MRILVRCEDTYGSSDMIKHAFQNMEVIEILKADMDEEVLDLDITHYNVEGNRVTLVSGLSSNRVLDFDSYRGKADVVIFVFDMDSWDGFKENSFILDLKILIDKINKYNNKVNSDKDNPKVQLLFAPTFFSAETIMLYKNDIDGGDFSTVFSRSYTARLHTQMLFDLIHEKYEGIPYWKETTNWKKFNIKQTRLFLDRGLSIKSLVEELRRRNYSNYNDIFLNWLTGKNIITNIKGLLTVEQMIKMLEQYLEEYNKFLASSKENIIYNGKNYDLRHKYDKIGFVNKR